MRRELGNSLLLAAAVALAACGSGGGFPDAAPIDAPPPPGTFSLQWTLTDSGGTTVTCTDAGAMSVVAAVHDDIDNSAFNDTFFCGVNAGTSGVVVPDTYDFTFFVKDSTGNTLGSAAGQQSVVIDAGKNTALAPLTFVIASAP